MMLLKIKKDSSKSIPFFLFSSLLVLLISVFVFRVKDEMVDFEVNYKAGKRLLQGEMLYRVEDGHYMFKYLPSSAFLYLPFSLLPLTAAKAIWYVLTIFSLTGLVYLSVRFLPEKKIKPYLLYLFPPLILMKFFLREIQLGQINALVTLILLLTIWSTKENRASPPRKGEILAGLTFGISVALKPYAFIFFPYFLVKRKWMSLLSGTSVILLALLIPSLFFGLKGNLDVFKEWFITLSQSTPSQLVSQDNISIMAFFMKWTDEKLLSLLLYSLLIFILSLLMLILIHKGKRIHEASVLEGSLLLIFIPLISPLGWDYTLLMSVLGIAILINNFFYFSLLSRIVLFTNLFIICFSLYDLMGRELYSKFMSLSVLTVNFLVIVGYLAFLRVRKLI